MRIVTNKIPLSELKKMATNRYGNLVKAVVDIKKKLMVVDADLHADQEALLLKKDSKQKDLWGINLYPFEKGNKRIEFDSIINIRPILGNLTRSVDKRATRELIKKVVSNLIKE